MRRVSRGVYVDIEGDHPQAQGAPGSRREILLSLVWKTLHYEGSIRYLPNCLLVYFYYLNFWYCGYQTRYGA